MLVEKSNAIIGPFVYAYVRVFLWGMAYWCRKQHQSTKLSAFVSDRPKIICRQLCWAADRFLGHRISVAP